MSKALSTVLLIILVTFCCHFFNRSGYSSFSMYLCPRQWAIETGWWLSVGSSLTSKACIARLHWQANQSRMRNWERSLIRNPIFPQSLRLPLFTKGLRFYPKLLHLLIIVSFLQEKKTLSLTSLLIGVAGERGMRNEGCFPYRARGSQSDMSWMPRLSQA